jgi:inhibitor of cysteine peptidase
MGRKVCLIVVIILLIALGRYASASLSSNVKLGKADAGKTFDLAKGGTLEITLEGNPTTGYNWSQVSSNDGVLKPVGAYTYQQNPAPAGMVGVGGKFTFNFKAIGVGATQLKFSYQRPWEKNVTPIETFELNINVK